MVFNALNRPKPDEGSITGVCLTDFTGQNKRNDKRPIADTISLYLLSIWVRGKGRLIFSLHYSTALSLAGHTNYLTFNTHTNETQ